MKFKNNLDPKYTKISLYVISTVVIIYLLLQLAGNLNALLSGIGTGIHTMLTILAPVFWGFLLAYLLKPMCDWIERKLKETAYFQKKTKGTRTIAITVTFLGLLIGLVILFSLVISAVSSQLQVASVDSLVVFFNSMKDSIQALYNDLMNYLKALSVNSEAIQQYVTQISSVLGKWIKNIGTDLASSATAIPAFFSNLMFVVIFAIYFLADGDRIRVYWGRVYHALFGDRATEKGIELLKIADRVFSGYFRGQMIDAVFMMVMISISLSLVGVKFSVIIGVLAGIGNLIPYVGPFIAYGSTILVCLVNGSFLQMAIALVVLFIIQGIDGNIINPKLLGANVNIHPMYVVISLLIGGSVGGLVGMLFAVPVAAFVKELFDRMIGHILMTRAKKQEKPNG